MLKKEDRLKLEGEFALHREELCVLQLLYGPLIGKEALILYEELYALSVMPTQIKNHLLVQKLNGGSMELIEKSRVILEQYLLLKTYYDATKHAYIYRLISPKSGMEFLNHEVFGRMVMKKLGKQAYEYMRKGFAPRSAEKEGYQDITMSMRSLMAEWNDEEEHAFTALRPDVKELHTAFRFDVFLNGLSTMILPASERTKENLMFIAEKADLYGIDEKEMQKLVGKSMDLKRNQLDHKKLVGYIQRSHQEFTKVIDDPYAMPPVRFLQAKQKGIAVSGADQRLIDDTLYGKYQLKPDVINVLIEYVLDRCHQMFRKTYVEKVAATWVRLGIDTKEKALEIIQQEGTAQSAYQKPQEKQLPKWFNDQDSVNTTEEDIDDQELAERLRRLGVNDG